MKLILNTEWGRVLYKYWLILTDEKL